MFPTRTGAPFALIATAHLNFALVNTGQVGRFTCGERSWPAATCRDPNMLDASQGQEAGEALIPGSRDPICESEKTS